MMTNRLPTWLRQFFQPTKGKQKRKSPGFRPCLEFLEERATPAVFLVTSTANGFAGVTSDGTLRAAILNSNLTPGPNIIEFDIETPSLSGFFTGAETIFLTTPLPTLANTVTIDGTSQPGWTSIPLIAIDGSQIQFPCNGLTTTAPGCKIEGLILQNFLDGDGIGLFSSNNVVLGNTLNSDGEGIEIANAASGNTIGGVTVRDANTFMSNGDGVFITDSSFNNVVEGNDMGFNPKNPQAPAGNNEGVVIESGTNNTIGGTASGTVNIICGSLTAAIFVNLSASGNVIEGNDVGPGTSTVVSSTSPNGDGIDVSGANNTIGGTAAGAGNVIGGNEGTGVVLAGQGNFVEGNLIGVNVQGKADPNFVGVEVIGTANTIGGVSTGAGNVISGNTGAGVGLSGHQNLLEGNFIGTNITGTRAVANGSDGVQVSGSQNTIGAVGAGNVISGNTGDGILIEQMATLTQVEANKVGTDITATLPVPNVNGIVINGSQNTVGGQTKTITDATNIIAFNTNDGVLVASSPNSQGPVNKNEIRANTIFGNGHLGIEIQGNANAGIIAPVLVSPAVFAAKKITVSVTIPNVTKLDNFTLDFFANQSNESQGRLYIGSAPITPKIGTGTSTIPVSVTVTSAFFSTQATPEITATITDGNLNTSEFSSAVHDPVLSAPAFTSARTAAFTVNTPGSFAVTTSGFPTPTLTLTGTLPKGLTFDRTTGVISGIPAPGTSGTHVLHITARNGVGAAATQTVTIAVAKQTVQLAVPTQVSVAVPAKVTSLANYRFEAVFTVTETASPLSGRLTITGFTGLPTGVTFDSSTAEAFVGTSKKLSLVVIFTNTTPLPLATLLAGLSPIVEEIIA